MTTEERLTKLERKITNKLKEPNCRGGYPLCGAESVLTMAEALIKGE